MALIKCPECGGQVSDKAPACIFIVGIRYRKANRKKLYGMAEM